MSADRMGGNDRVVQRITSDRDVSKGDVETTLKDEKLGSKAKVAAKAVTVSRREQNRDFSETKKKKVIAAQY
ncbi:MAG: hypothetical protein EOL87_08855 [Spartobacteria bacterium]|nr:hypothetical protein [Spartobacteria bacterium]